MKKHNTSYPPALRIQLNNKDIPTGLVYFTGNAISSWSDRVEGVATELNNCIWHADISSGTLLYIVTDMKK